MPTCLSDEMLPKKVDRKTVPKAKICQSSENGGFSSWEHFVTMAC
jgi:hypothetical protein